MLILRITGKNKLNQIKKRNGKPLIKEAPQKCDAFLIVADMIFTSIILKNICSTVKNKRKTPLLGSPLRYIKQIFFSALAWVEKN